MIIISLYNNGCILPINNSTFKTDTGITLVSRAQNSTINTYVNGEWHSSFLYGINLGATTPGYHPGELSPTYEDYRRWFADMEELGVDLVRVYTILPPYFYEALVDHNKQTQRKLWLIQGIWSPEEKLIEELNAYSPSIVAEFHNEIRNAVHAVFGDGEIPPTTGKASGIYSVNAAPYLLAWMVGTEWYPYMVDNTNKINSNKAQFSGDYFKTASQASPFEAWLAQCLDVLATEESGYGWQHPVSFVNWVTTDPLVHPNEPFENEDLVSVDPMNIEPTSKWYAGYFAAYHVYPYYPDSLRYQKNYLEYTNSLGQNDPYEAYLQELRSHHTGIPLLIAEFGVPSSRGMAHRGALNRNQGMHTETEQGEMTLSMFDAIKRSGCGGGILFAWQDEWFKFTWNTLDLEIPAERRPMWLNRLTNEENFGLLAIEPGYWTKIYVDGKTEDWQELEDSNKASSAGHVNVQVTSDEGYVYLLLEKSNQWNWLDESIYIGFDTQPGGNKTSHQDNLQFNNPSEFLLSINNTDDAELTVASSYDQHTYLYGKVLSMISFDQHWANEDSGIFLPWKLCLNREIYLPNTKEQIPFEEITLGNLIYGVTDPNSSEYNSLADFFIKNNTLEIRIPWMLLGFTDPSTHQVWSYPYRENLGHFTSVTSPGINIECIVTNKKEGSPSYSTALMYNWENWNYPSYHERKKQSYYMLQEYINKGN